MYKSLSLHLLESYFRHRWLNLLPILILAIASVVYLFVSKADYVAQGSLYVNSQSLLASLTDLNNNNNSLWVTPAQATSGEISELVKTDSFVRAMIKQTNLEATMAEGPAAVDEVFTNVRKEIDVTTSGNNQIQVSVSDSDPVLAYQLANSLIENYIQWKMNSKKTESQAAVDFFDKLITEYQVSLDQTRAELKAYIGAHPEPVRGSRPYLEQFEIDRLNGQIKAAQDRYGAALDKEENAKLSLQQIESDTRQTYILIDAPEVPIKPSLSLKKVGLSLAAFYVVGIFLSIALIVAGHLIDQTVRFTEDVTAQLGLPVLAMIPEMAGAGKKQLSAPRPWGKHAKQLTKGPESGREKDNDEDIEASV